MGLQDEIKCEWRCGTLQGTHGSVRKSKVGIIGEFRRASKTWKCAKCIYQGAYGADMDIFLYVPQGMIVEKDEFQRLGVQQVGELVLQLQRSLYRLKQEARLLSKTIAFHIIAMGIRAMCHGNMSVEAELRVRWLIENLMY
ncbi:unnamed protein product [Albugo candida]|uniref:Uncharacterized protein n=1 Tax=Albugo candida TaxID=65357 RepID=A0A024FW23_9STRA|nr:unnamed protein product [Albugo candida]|eukprot:CCI11325.1 unnamed protein product [Albugo candida]